MTGRLADPFESVAVPRLVVPSLKVTLPVTVPVPGATTVTVAVRVTDWPVTDGFGEAVSVVLVVMVLTTCVTTVDVLVA